MSVKIGEQTIGIGSMHVTMMRFMMNLVSQGVGLGVRAADAATDEDLKERIRNLPDGGLLESALDNGQEANIFKFSGDNTLLKFLRGQIAPLTGASWDIATGRNFIGEPTDENLWGIDFNSPLVSLPFCCCFCNNWTFPDRFLELTDYNTNVALKIKLRANIDLQRDQILQPYKNQFLNIGISFD